MTILTKFAFGHHLRFMNEFWITFGQVLFALSTPVLYAEDSMGKTVWEIKSSKDVTYTRAKTLKDRRRLSIITAFWGFGIVFIGVGLCA